MHWICLIVLVKIKAHLLTSNHLISFISNKKVWFQSDFTFQILYLNLRWRLTSVYSCMWHLTSSTNEGSHLASIYKTQVKLKSTKARGRYNRLLQQQTKEKKKKKKKKKQSLSPPTLTRWCVIHPLTTKKKICLPFTPWSSKVCHIIGTI